MQWQNSHSSRLSITKAFLNQEKKERKGAFTKWWLSTPYKRKNKVSESQGLVVSLDPGADRDVIGAFNILLKALVDSPTLFSQCAINES